MSKQNFDKFINKEVKGAKKKEQLKQEKKISKKEREAYFIEKKRQVRAEKKQQAPPPFAKESKPQWQQTEKRSFDKPSENKWAKDKDTKKYPSKKDGNYPQKDSAPGKYDRDKKPVRVQKNTYSKDKNTPKPFRGKAAPERENKEFGRNSDRTPSSFKKEEKVFDKRPANKSYEARTPNERKPISREVPAEVKKPASYPKQTEGSNKKFTPKKDWKPASNTERKRSFEQRPERKSNDPGLPYARKPIQKIVSVPPAQKPPKEKHIAVVKRAEPSATGDMQVKALAEESIMPLNKYIAHGGICSRRDAGELVKAGKVKVNGIVVTEPGYKVQKEDVVIANGKKVVTQVNLVYILLNKPKDYITTAEDPQGRKTVLDIVRSATTERIYPVGRLDRNTSGVLLLTNDGELAQHLTHPSYEVRKIYEAKLDKPLAKADFDKLLNGITLEDGEVMADSVAYADSKDKSVIGIEIHSGRNRVVRRMFEHLGYDVKGLDRVMFANLTKKNVERGKWRFLNDKEVRLLKFFNKSKR